MGVQAGQQEVVAGADEPHLLCLHQHVSQDLLLAVEHDQVGLGEENLLEDVAEAVVILLQLLHHDPELVLGLNGGGVVKDLLECHH